MIPAAIIVVLVLYGGGLVLAANWRTWATLAGNFLVGKRRFRFIHLQHRRERIMRTVGCFACAIAASLALARVTRDNSTIELVVLLLGLIPPVCVWIRTNQIHGVELADDVASQKLFSGHK